MEELGIILAILAIYAFGAAVGYSSKDPQKEVNTFCKDYGQYKTDKYELTCKVKP